MDGVGVSPTMRPWRCGSNPSSALVVIPSRGTWGAGHRAAQLLARADAELREHLAQVVLDRARADEQLGPDFGIGQPARRQSGDLRFLRGEQGEGVGAVSAGVLAGG